MTRSSALLAVLLLAGCTEAELTDAQLADMEDAAPGGQLGVDNACSATKRDFVNDFGVDYRYEKKPQYRVVSNTSETNGLLITHTSLVDDGYIEYFHYFSRTQAFDARTGTCKSYRLNG